MGEEIRSCAGKCVLVVDDNEFNRELVREILEDEAIIVYESDDGKSGRFQRIILAQLHYLSVGKSKNSLL